MCLRYQLFFRRIRQSNSKWIFGVGWQIIACLEVRPCRLGLLFAILVVLSQVC